MEIKRQLRIGPVRRQRIGAAISVPIVILANFWAQISSPAKLVLLLLGVLATYRAVRMGVEIAGDKVIVRNFLTSISVELQSVRSAQLIKPRGGLYRLALTHETGAVIIASGVTAFGEALPLPFVETRRVGRAKEKVEELFRDTQVSCRPPAH